MKQNLLFLFDYACIIVVSAVFGALCYARFVEDRETLLPSTIVTHDTLTITTHDTVHIIETKLVSERFVRHDTVWVEMPNDTVFFPVEVDRVQREFAGDGYRAWVSGCCSPNLDKIDIEKSIVETIVTKTISDKPKKWGLGIQIGGTYSASQHDFVPYVGVGVSYNLFRW